MSAGARLIWLFFGGVFLLLAIIGILLPLVPTTPFLLLTAYCFARSSNRLHNWLLSHKHFGPLILNWQETGSIDRTSKISAMVVILGTLVLSVAVGVPFGVFALQLVILSCVAGFILTRPLPPQ